MPQKFPPPRGHGDKEPETSAPCGGEDVGTASLGVPARPGVREIGGPSGLEPTRYGDWEHGGRCTDF